MASKNKIPIDIESLKLRMLVHEAKRWVCFMEKGGNNKGQMVEAFQKAVDGKAVGEPWCMSFVQYCLKQVDALVDEVFKRKFAPSGMESTEHCLTAWHKSPQSHKFRAPKVGRVAIWRQGNSTSGHTGIVVQLEKDSPYMWTIEGNTGPSDAVQREGDGVFLKRRHIKGTGKMKIQGFIQPWV